MGIGDWGLGIGDWGLGPIPNPQSPIPNPQSPSPIPNYLILLLIKIFKNNMESENNRLTIKNRSIQKITFQKKNIFCCFKTFLIILFLILCVFMHFFIINKININQKLINTILKLYKINQQSHYSMSGNVNNIEFKHSYNKTIDEKLKMLRLITNNNKYKYEGPERCLLSDPDSQYCFYHLLVPKKVIGKKRILNGEKKSGCYITLDDFTDIKIAYSIGVSNNIHFDNSLVNRGIDVYMYDHTIQELPNTHSNFHWEKIGLAGKGNTNVQLKTLEELMAKNGHTNNKNMILKIDCEGCEWDSLKDVPEKVFLQFKYILMEFHLEENGSLELYYNVLKKLSKNHQVIYIHCYHKTIIVLGNNIFCKFFEVSYVIKDNNSFEVDESIYPIFEFDYYTKQEQLPEMNLNILKLYN
jgi:FkbM family methyltransferase